MAKVTLDINDKNLDIVLNILNNLKSGLIKEIEINKQVKPISSSLNSNTQKRYLSKNQFKEKLNQNTAPNPLPKTVTSRYLSKEEFKKKLKG